jgi:hypothetical protein
MTIEQSLFHRLRLHGYRKARDAIVSNTENRWFAPASCRSSDKARLDVINAYLPLPRGRQRRTASYGGRGATRTAG